MFHTARTSARSLLVAAGAAGFVALGVGVAGADTLGGATEGLPLGDLGNQVPSTLTDGVTSPVGDLAKVEPGEISAQPELQHQSGPADALGTSVGDSVSADTPLVADEENATTVGPLDLEDATETLPLSGGSVDPLSGGAVDPLSGVLGGMGLLDGLSLDGGGQTLPLSNSEAPLGLDETTSVVEDTVTELGDRAETGIHETNPDLVELDEVDLGQLGETVPMSDPVGLDAGENADLTGGLTTLLPQDVNDTLPMSASETDLVGDLLPETPGGDLIDVQGLPELGEPEVGTDMLPMHELPVEGPSTEQLDTDELNTDQLPVDVTSVLGDELPLGL